MRSPQLIIERIKGEVIFFVNIEGLIRRDAIPELPVPLGSSLFYSRYSMLMLPTDGSFLNMRAPGSMTTRIPLSFFHETFAEPLSTMKAFPVSFGKLAVVSRTDAWVLIPVVAPQLRENKTIFFLPSGESNSWRTLLTQLVPRQPVTAKRRNRDACARFIFLASVCDHLSLPVDWHLLASETSQQLAWQRVGVRCVALLANLFLRKLEATSKNSRHCDVFIQFFPPQSKTVHFDFNLL